MKLKLKTLRANLFFYQVLLIGIILLVAGALSYIYISRTFVKMIRIEQDSLGESLANSIETEFDKMNIVSMNICYSNLIKEMFKEYQQFNGKTEIVGSRVKKYNDQTLLFESILGIMGPFYHVNQVNLYTFDGFMVGSGLFNEETKVKMENIPKIQEAIKNDGLKYLTPPEKNSYLANKNLQLKDNYFISLLRVFKDQHHQNEGIVEVLQDCEKIFSAVDLQEKSKKSLKVFVLNKKGEILYPYNENRDISSKELLNILGSEEIHDSINFVDFKGDFSREIVSVFHIDTYGLNIIFLQSKYNILTPLRRFQILFFIFLIFITLYTIIVSYSVSARVTLPLEKLVNFISGLKLNNYSLEKNENYKHSDNTFEEIDKLYNAFNRMSGKLRTSLNELIALKDQEALTRLLTLQSQMNPHFLYNNLANLSILAEENKNDQVVSMCRDISFMLRYSTEKAPGGSNILGEIEYVETYLKCLTVRYEDDLKYKISIPKEMNDIRIPRILIQPLVENCINHGFISEPPWEIKVEGFINDDKWFISVSDNGIGFPEDILIKYNKSVPNKILHSEHLGLENTKQRLELIYKNNAVFILQNLYTGGSSVTIGGNINYYEDRYEG
ncbi:MAG: histidine kinase [Spirochaetales bacterium]|nr:histidine kinase [Spirochaetales bacterium]